MTNEKSKEVIAKKRAERAARQTGYRGGDFTFTYMTSRPPPGNSAGTQGSADPSLGASQTSGAALSGPTTLTDNASVSVSSPASGSIGLAQRASILAARKTSQTGPGIAKQRRTRFKPKIIRRRQDPLLGPAAPSLQPSSFERHVEMEDEEKEMGEDERAADDRANGREFVRERVPNEDVYYGAGEEEEEMEEEDRAWWDFEGEDDV